MLKKSQLSEKLKKLKLEGASIEKPVETGDEGVKSVGNNKGVVAVKDDPTAESSLPEPEEPQAPSPAPEEPVPDEQANISVDEPDEVVEPSQEMEKPIDAGEPVLKVKKVNEIEDKRPDELIEPLIQEKQELSYISDLGIPAKKLSKLFKVETNYTDNTLNQIFTAWKDPDKVIKWTVKLDKHGQEFYSLRGEGLMKMKDDPPIFGMEFDDGAIISTHMGDYTFIMGCYNFDVKSLVKIFAYGIDNAKRYQI